MNDQLKISSGATSSLYASPPFFGKCPSQGTRIVHALSINNPLFLYLFDYMVGAAVWAPSTRLGKVDRGWLVPKKTGYCRSPPWSWASPERLVPKKQRPGGVGQVQSDLFQRNNDPVELGKSRVTCSKETTTDIVKVRKPSFGTEQSPNLVGSRRTQTVTPILTLLGPNLRPRNPFFKYPVLAYPGCLSSW